MSPPRNHSAFSRSSCSEIEIRGGAVFAYGQTGTGKTYTMEGGIDKASGTTIPASAGVVPRAVAQVLERKSLFNVCRRTVN
jgi:hypothetical protein